MFPQCLYVQPAAVAAAGPEVDQDRVDLGFRAPSTIRAVMTATGLWTVR